MEDRQALVIVAARKPVNRNGSYRAARAAMTDRQGFVNRAASSFAVTGEEGTNLRQQPNASPR
jgi:hypothetical protein